MEVKEVTLTRVQFTEPSGKVQVFTDNEGLQQHYKIKLQSEHNVIDHYAKEILKHADQSIALEEIRCFINMRPSPLVKEEGRETPNYTLDKLIARLIELRKTTPGDYHVMLCTEHEMIGGQLEEPIRDLTASHREGKVILLAESFK